MFIIFIISIFAITASVIALSGLWLMIKKIKAYNSKLAFWESFKNQALSEMAVLYSRITGLEYALHMVNLKTENITYDEKGNLAMKKPEPPRITRKCAHCDEPPFAHYRTSDNGEHWWYECTSCQKKTDEHNTKEEARTAWENLQNAQ